MKVELKDGNLVITMPFNEVGKVSASGKSLVHATTNGNKDTDLLVKGKTLVLGINAYTSTK